jgi:electron transfer flavoprotein beta subunit
LEVLSAADIGVDFTPRNKVVKVEEPPARKGGVLVDSTDALIEKLKNEAKVIKS